MNVTLNTPNLARRMACWLYEGMLAFGVVFVAGCLFFITGQVFGAFNASSAMSGHNPFLQAFLFIVLGIYFVWLWAKGQTLAMKTWEIRVVDHAGQPITQKRALIRYLLSWLWFLPALAAVAPFNLSGTESAIIVIGWVAVWAILSRFHPQNQFWHDALAGTRLISAPRLNSTT
jgi:uncharacterized RDD family membrane protein YckC